MNLYDIFYLLTRSRQEEPQFSAIIFGFFYFLTAKMNPSLFILQNQINFSFFCLFPKQWNVVLVDLFNYVS